MKLSNQQTEQLHAKLYELTEFVAEHTQEIMGADLGEDVEEDAAERLDHVSGIAITVMREMGNIMKNMENLTFKEVINELSAVKGKIKELE